MMIFDRVGLGQGGGARWWNGALGWDSRQGDGVPELEKPKFPLQLEGNFGDDI